MFPCKTVLFSGKFKKRMVPRTGFEPARPKRALAPQASVSTNSTTWALIFSRVQRYIFFLKVAWFLENNEGIAYFCPNGYCGILMKGKTLIVFILFSFAKLLVYGQSGQVDERNLGQLPENVEKVETLTSLSWKYKSTDPEKALLYGKEALKIAKQLSNQKLIADANHTIGMIHWYKGDYQKASKYFFDALYIREIIQDKLGLSRSYNNIGLLFFRQKDYEKAFRYYMDGLKIRQELKDSTGLIYSYNNLGDVLVERGLLEDAKKNYFRALEIAKEKGHYRGESFVLYNLGKIYRIAANPDSATIVLQQSLDIANANNEKAQVAKSLTELASIDLKRGDYEAALTKALEAKKISTNLGLKESLATAYAEIAKSYAGLGEYQKAYEENVHYGEISSELSDAEIEKSLKEIQYNYEDAKEKLALSEKVRKLSNNGLILVGMVLVMAVIAGVSLFYRYRNQKRTNEQLRENNEFIKRQNDALLQSNSALEQFAYVASHDLKEPLRNINTYSFLLSENIGDDVKEKAKVYLDLISAGAKHMNDLLQGILAYSRLARSSQALNELVDLNKTVRNVQEVLRNSIEEKNVIFEIDHLPVIRSNKMQMHQLFQNLISNAIKFNDKAQPIVQIRYEIKTDGHHFYFIDNGIGFDEKFKNKVFQIFQRLEGRKYSGTGVGMAICKNIVNQHNGNIEVSSIQGEGTTFHVFIPFMDPSENALIL